LRIQPVIRYQRSTVDASLPDGLANLAQITHLVSDEMNQRYDECEGPVQDDKPGITKLML